MTRLFATVFRALLTTLCALGALGHPAYANAESHSSIQPIYAIAHRVLLPSSVTAALSHGANALEIDLVAGENEWWAEHPGGSKSIGISARELFTFIADERRNGKNVIFIWLDIKNPDKCGYAEEGCSVGSLKELVREILEPVGIKALYGFYKTEDSFSFMFLSEEINDNEAISLNGAASDVVGAYEYTDISQRQRIMDYGRPHLDQGFGDCHEIIGRGLTCANLRHGSDGRDRGLLGKVMGWTSTRGDTQRVQMLFLSSRVDGIIYGFQDKVYEDDAVTREAFHDISSWVESHPDTLRMATIDDAPW